MYIGTNGREFNIRFLRKKKLHTKIKGDFVKANSRRIVNAAFELVNLGASVWKNH